MTDPQNELLHYSQGVTELQQKFNTLYIDIIQDQKCWKAAKQLGKECKNYKKILNTAQKNGKLYREQVKNLTHRVNTIIQDIDKNSPNCIDNPFKNMGYIVWGAAILLILILLIAGGWKIIVGLLLLSLFIKII